jgi:hypothetical protein
MKKNKNEYTMFSLGFIINRVSLRKCLLCEKNLDKELGHWHIPLCKEHRLEFIQNEKNKKTKKNKVSTRILSKK